MSLYTTAKTKDICYHCGATCVAKATVVDTHHFCCEGCAMVYNILKSNDLCTYYDLNQSPGIQLMAKPDGGKWAYLNQPEVLAGLLDFSSEHLNHLQLFIPAVHCSSCTWLLENFHKMKDGVLSSDFNFVEKQLSISYNPKKVRLSEIAATLDTIGYAPHISLASGDTPKKAHQGEKRLIFQLAVAGLCMGNIMLFSFPEYLGLELDAASGLLFEKVFRYLSLALSIPVVLYAAQDYLAGSFYSIRSLWQGQNKSLSVDVPIAIGILALWLRSIYLVLWQSSAGYFDSLAGLVFLLLCGKWLQARSQNKLRFEHEYQSYFPLAVQMAGTAPTLYKNVKDLKVGDRILVKNGGIIPADGILLSTVAHVDYSFVTGEAKAIKLQNKEAIHAGGRVVGPSIELSLSKTSSQSYLTQLWNRPEFGQEKVAKPTDLAQNFVKYFTIIAIAIALLSFVYWYINDQALMWQSAIAVLMVACPCALTLSHPFTMNLVTAIFGKNKFYFKNQNYTALLTEIDCIVFDKTGTLSQSNQVPKYQGQVLGEKEKNLVYNTCRQSSHPYSQAIGQYLASACTKLESTEYYEYSGQGIEAWFGMDRVRLGNAGFVLGQAHNKAEGNKILLEINGKHWGSFTILNELTLEMEEMLAALAKKYELHLLSGDKAQPAFQSLAVFKSQQYQQQPSDKYNYIKRLRDEGKKVMMVGDGLNDAGALKAADIGIAVAGNESNFSPASDAILLAENIIKLPIYMRYVHEALTMVKWSFWLSIFYNFIGVGLAAAGKLSPLFAAIFMPLSSISVLVLAVLGSRLLAKIKYTSLTV